MASILSRPQCVNVTSRPEQNGTFCIHFQIRFVVLKLFYPISNSSWYFIKGLYHYPRPEWVVWCLQWVHRAHNYWHRWVCLTRRIHAYPRPPFWNVILRLNKSKGRHFEDILNACSRDNIFVFWSGLLILIIIIITCSRTHSYYRPLTCNSRQSVVSDVSKRTSTRGSHAGTTWGACLYHRGPRSAASPTERKQKIRGYEDTNNVVGFKHFIYVLSYYHLPVERYGTNSSSRGSELIFICGKGNPRFNQKPHIWSYMFSHSKRLAIHCQCTGVTTGLHTNLPLFCGTYAWRSESPIVTWIFDGCHICCDKPMTLTLPLQGSNSRKMPYCTRIGISTLIYRMFHLSLTLSCTVSCLPRLESSMIAGRTLRSSTWKNRRGPFLTSMINMPKSPIPP